MLYFSLSRKGCLGDWLNCRHGDVVDIGKLLEVHKYYSEDVDVKMERPAEESALEGIMWTRQLTAVLDDILNNLTCVS
ncbi:hypothetical protein Hanom_Chr17g01551761 [Helianthus anomalus]